VLTIIDEETTNGASVPPPHLPPLARITLALASPPLRAYGLPLHDVCVTGDTVALKLGSAIEGAVLTPYSAAALVQRLLRDTVHPAVIVHVA
jgi:hypothetical protein